MKLKTLTIGILSAIVLIPTSKLACDIASTYQTQLQTIEVNGQYFGWWGQEQTQKVSITARDSAYIGAGIGATATGLIAFILWGTHERNRNHRNRGNTPIADTSTTTSYQEKYERS